MCTYLLKRGSVYYFRRSVPDDLVGQFLNSNGKPLTEWTYSLGVKDRGEAKRLIPARAMATDKIISEARARPSTNSATAARQSPTELGNDSLRQLLDRQEQHSREGAEYFYQQDVEEEFRRDSDPLYKAQTELRDEVALKVRELREKRENAAYLAEQRAANGVGLLELFDRYAAVPGRGRRTVAHWRTIMVKLIAFIGHNDERRLGHKELVAWRNYLRDSIQPSGKHLSASTINGSYLAMVDAVFAWAKGDDLVEKNPMAEVTKIVAPKAPKLRDPEFTKDEYTAILTASTKPSLGKRGQHFQNAVRWCPWLAAYSGARINELTQLRKQDVSCIDGIWAYKITPEAGTVKGKEARLVPLHRHLITQGFLDFVDAQPLGPLFYDDSKRHKVDALNTKSKQMGTKLAAWVRLVGVTGDVQPNHGWRHLFNTLAGNYDLDHRIAKSIMGHANSDSNAGYGSISLEAKLRELAKLPDFVA
jgi:integrase